MIAADVPCPLRILYVVNRANTRSTSLAREPLESHESRLPIIAYYFAYYGQNKIQFQDLILPIIGKIIRCINGTYILHTQIITDNVLHKNPDSIGKLVEMVH